MEDLCSVSSKSQTSNFDGWTIKQNKATNESLWVLNNPLVAKKISDDKKREEEKLNGNSDDSDSTSEGKAGSSTSGNNEDSTSSSGGKAGSQTDGNFDDSNSILEGKTGSKTNGNSSSTSNGDSQFSTNDAFGPASEMKSISRESQNVTQAKITKYIESLKIESTPSNDFNFTYDDRISESKAAVIYQEARIIKYFRAFQVNWFKQLGLIKTEGGYVFPGTSDDEIEEALQTREKNRRNQIKPPLPNVTATSMDLIGQVTIQFDEEILMPQSLENKFWDFLLEVQVLSINDESIYTGLFGNLSRRLQIDDQDESHLYEFYPTVYRLNSTAISIRFNFVEPSNLEISQQANFRIRIKEPVMLKTKNTMAALTRDQIFDGQIYHEEAIPPQIVDVEEAKIVKKSG